LTNVVAIAAGGSRCLALKREGTVTVVWGDNYPYLPSEPLHLTNVIGIAAGENFCLALQTNAP
jgi:alpha-tubulin suppressor-like RCC1 family protein